jgi:predicted RecA/RadA family phage recombinase
MAEYAPIYEPGQAAVYTASATITAGQLVEVTGVGTVGPAAADSIIWLGVAAADYASGDRVTILRGGVQSLLMAGSAAVVEDILVTAAAGCVVADATPTAGAIVGIALSSVADAARVECWMVR